MENCPFKPGDKLVCIRDGGWAEKFLVEGQTYTFSRNDSTSPDIFVEGSDFSWLGDRFQLAPEAKPAQKFKVGDRVRAVENTCTLVKDEVYTVTSVTDQFVYVNGNDRVGAEGWLHSRFVLAEAAKPLPYDAAFEAGRALGRLEGTMEMVTRLGVGYTQEQDPADGEPYELTGRRS